MRELVLRIVARQRKAGVNLTADEVQSTIYELLSQVRLRYRRKETNLETLKWLLDLKHEK